MTILKDTIDPEVTVAWVDTDGVWNASEAHPYTFTVEATDVNLDTLVVLKE